MCQCAVRTGGGRNWADRSTRPQESERPYLHFRRVVNRFGLLFLLEFGPLIDLLLSLISLDSVTFLQLADEALAPAGNIVKVIVGKLTPLLLHRSLQLLPLTFYSVP